MKALKSISCEKIKDKEAFMIKWDFDITDNIKKVRIAEIDVNESRFAFTRCQFQTINNPEKKQTEKTVSDDSNEHRFLVFGMSDDENPDLYEMGAWCRSQELSSISCMGINISGELRWHKEATGDNMYNITIKGNTNLPEGYLYYQYSFYGKIFMFLVPFPIRADCTETMEIYLPKEHTDFKFLTENTQVKCIENKNLLDKGKNPSNSVLEKIKNFFERRKK